MAGPATRRKSRCILAQRPGSRQAGRATIGKGRRLDEHSQCQPRLPGAPDRGPPRPAGSDEHPGHRKSGQRPPHAGSSRATGGPPATTPWKSASKPGWSWKAGRSRACAPAMRRFSTATFCSRMARPGCSAPGSRRWQAPRPTSRRTRHAAASCSCTPANWPGFSRPPRPGGMPASPPPSTGRTTG